MPANCLQTPLQPALEVTIHGERTSSVSAKCARRRLGDLLPGSHIGALSNHWITLHEIGNVSGFVPILVMDVWEHAYLLDYAPADRPKYIDAFFANVDWDVVQGRLGKKIVAPAA
jgi:superoxide dismutase